MHLILARSWTFFALVCSVSVLADAMASRSVSIVLIIPMISSSRFSSRRISAFSRGGNVRRPFSRAQSFQLLHPIAAQRLVVIDAMDREQSLDPVESAGHAHDGADGRPLRQYPARAQRSKPLAHSAD